MCAIAGFIGLAKQRLPENSEYLLECMLQKMSQRGPDATSKHIDAQKNYALGHARLAIISLDEQGVQPMLSADGWLIIVLNGEIYNYRELRQQLQQEGTQFRTETDTEVVLEAYARWGVDCLQHLEGMFAFALFDARTNQWLLARDRIGAKPLYFSWQQGFFAFASQANALTQLPWVKEEPNLEAFYHYLTFMSVPAPLTSVQKIYKLPAGFAVTIDAVSKSVKFAQWYCPIRAVVTIQKMTATMQLPEIVLHVKQLLNKTLKQRLICDVPVAAFLSGGLDSSLLVALAAQQGYKLATFNVSFTGTPINDERMWARRVAQMFGCQHTEIVLSTNDLDALSAEMLRVSDQPLADCVNLPLLALAAACRQHGFKVTLSGEGADEIFWGYPQYAKQLKINGWLEKCGFLRSKLLHQVFKFFVQHLPLKSGAVALLDNFVQRRFTFWGAAIAFHEHEKTALKKQLAALEETPDPIVAQIFPQLQQSYDSGNWIKFYLDQVDQILPNADFAQRVTFLELKHRIPDLLLARLDSMTMAHGVEAREPLLDHELIEFVLALPTATRIGKGQLKGLLKLAAADFLPRELIYRTKVGFGVPAQNLSAGDLSASNNFPLKAKNSAQAFTLKCWKM